MGMTCMKVSVRMTLGLFLIASMTVVAMSATSEDDAVSALILTTTGKTLQGKLTGILPTVRLDSSSLTSFVGPVQAFDIPRAKIRQITLDFPRVVVETKDRVFVGPFSAFMGISELLILEQGTESLDLATASVRAIALHGTSLHPVPREWLGSTFLVMSLPTALEWTGEEIAEEPSELITPPEQEPHAVAPAEEPEPETPWWVGVLIIAALVALVLLAM